MAVTRCGGKGDRLFQFDQRCVGADRIHGLDQDFLDDTVAGSADALLHLHGFHYANFLAGRYLVSRTNKDGDHPSGQWRDDDVFRSGFEIGEEVVHKVYGKGPIKSLYLSRDKWFADVEFYKGVKSILVSFLKRPGEEEEVEEEIEKEVEEEISGQPIETEEEVVKESRIINTERSAPPIITPKTEPQSEDKPPETTRSIPVEDIDDIELDKDPEIEIREKIETKRLSDNDED